MLMLGKIIDTNNLHLGHKNLNQLHLIFDKLSSQVLILVLDHPKERLLVQNQWPLVLVSLQEWPLEEYADAQMMKYIYLVIVSPETIKLNNSPISGLIVNLPETLYLENANVQIIKYFYQANVIIDQDQSSQQIKLGQSTISMEKSL